MGDLPGSRCLRKPTAIVAVQKGAVMSCSAQRIQNHSVGQPATGASYRKIQKAPSVLQLAGCVTRSEEHTSELQSQSNLVCRLLLEKKKNIIRNLITRVYDVCVPVALTA